MTPLPRLATAFAVASVLTAVTLAADPCAEPTFSRYRSYSPGAGLRSMDTADLNGDGRQDVITAGDDARVTVHLSNPAGELIAGAVLEIGAQVKSLRSGEVTGDTLIDVVVGTATFVAVLPGDGAGGFGTPLVTTVEAREVAVGQFDFDAQLEIVATGPTTTNLLNADANGVVAQALPLGGGWLLDGEFNGDSLRDIAIANGTHLQVWLNTGGNAFTPSGDSFPTVSYDSGGTADLDGNGIDEILIHFGGGFRGFRINGASFTQIFEIWYGHGFAIEDMDGNGRLDIVTTYLYSFSIAYQLPTGEFTTPTSFPAPPGQNILKRADLDGDGERDWVIAGPYTLLTLPGRLFEPVVPETLHVGEGLSMQIRMTDLDHDGDLDAVVPMSMIDVPDANGYLAVLLYDSLSGRFAEAVRYAMPGNASYFDLADFNGDGELDLVTDGMLSGYSALFFGNGEGGFAAPTLISSLAYGVPTIHDLDNDGDSDIIMVGFSGEFAIVKNLGDTTFDSPSVQWNVGRMLPMPVNGDAFIDMVGIKPTGTTVYANDGTGDFSASTSTAFAIPSVSDAATGDLDGDGDHDIVVTSYESPAVTLIENLGGGLFALRAGTSLSGRQSVEVSDVSGDGLADVIVMDRNFDGALGRIYINRGSWTFAPAQPVVAEGGVDEIHVADLNADGRDDVVMMNHHAHVHISEQRCNSVEVDGVAGSTASSGFERVRVRGRGFKAGARAFFDDISVPVVFIDSMNVETISSPGLTAGTLADVRVVNLDEQSSTLANVLFVHFLDVDRSNGLFPFVERLVKARVTGGCGGGNFCPGSPVTRAQAAVFIEAARRGSTFVPPPPTGMFLDVPASHFAAAWIEQLARDGITGGCGGGNFCPSSPVTRGQVSVLLLAAKHGPGYQPIPATGVFSDVPADAPFARWIEQLARDGVTAGCGQNQFCPDQATTRGAMAVFISKTLLP
jgi:hypothetical protein